MVPPSLLATRVSYGQTIWLWVALLLAGGCTPQDHAAQGGEYLAEGNYDAAFPEYQQAVQADPKDYASYNSLAVLAGKRNDLTSALRYVDTALQINPGYTYAYVTRGVLQGEAGDSAACFAALTRAIELDSTYVEAYFNRGLYQAHFHRVLPALADFHQTITLAPTDYAAHFHLGRLLLQQGNQQEACQHLAEALSNASIPEAQELQQRYCKSRLADQVL